MRSVMLTFEIPLKKFCPLRERVQKDANHMDDKSRFLFITHR